MGLLFGSPSTHYNHCKTLSKLELNLERRLFARYVDDIVCTTKSRSKELLEKRNAVHKNFWFILECLDAKGDLAFLDMILCVRKENKIS